MQEYHEAEPVVQAYQALTTAQDHLAQAKALLEGEALDPDFKEMVQQEIGEKSQEVAQLENNLKILLLPKDVNDVKTSSWRCAAVPAAKKPPVCPQPDAHVHHVRSEQGLGAGSAEPQRDGTWAA